MLFRSSVFRTSATFKWQGFDGGTWTDVTGVLNETETTNNTYTYTLTQTGQKYTKYRLLGVSGATYYNRIYEIVPKVATTFKPSLHPKGNCSLDNDSDTVYNHLDLDSDDDGCSDSVEAGNTLVANNDTTNYNTGTDANNNGLLDQFEDGTTGNINYSSTYDLFARDNGINGCSDTDGDGIADVVDIDDDNDGVLDEDEGHFCSSNQDLTALTFTGGVTDEVVSRDEIYLPGGAGGWVTDYSDQDFQLPIHFEFTVEETAAEENAMIGFLPFGASQTTNNYNDGAYKFYINNTVTYGKFTNAWTTTTNPSTGYLHEIDIDENGNFTAKINGSVVHTTTVPVSTYKLAVTGYANPRRIQNIVFTHGTSAYTCVEIDTDGDTTPNHLDLDSDGDGCSDGVEAGNTLATDNDIVGYNTGTDANNNGLLDQFEDGTTGNINYTSTYSQYSLDNAQNLCTDTDGDGVGDIVDVDDDNDGIYDTDERNCNIIETTNPGDMTWHGTAAANVSAPVSTTLQVSGAAWSTAYSDQTFTLPLVMEGTVTSVGNGMIGFFPVSGTEITGATWNDGGYKFQFNNANGMYVRHGATNSGWHAPSIVGTTFRLEVDAAGNMSYIHNGSTVHTGTIPVEDYKITLSRGAFTITNFTVSGKGDSCLDIDSDGDTIPDHLELDSDDDGCSDANEAYGSYDTDGGDGGQYGTGDPLTVAGGEINPDGSVIAAAYDTGVVAAVTDDTISTVCPDDTDRDGIPDVVDLDDDNDGILDADECGGIDSGVINNLRLSNASNTTTGEVLIGSATAQGPYQTTNGGQFDVQMSGTGGYLLLDGVHQMTNTGSQTINFYETGTSNPVSLQGFVFTFSDWEGSGEVITGLTLTLDDGSTVVYNNANGWTGFKDKDGIGVGEAGTDLIIGASGLHTNYVLGGGGQNDKFGKLDVSNLKIRQIDLTGSGTFTFGWEDRSFFVDYYFTCGDTDFDGVPNNLDVDSDDDGCYDALEGAGSYDHTQLTDGAFTGGIDVNGVPTITSGGQATTAAVTDVTDSTACCDASVSGLDDIDADGIVDSCDLDNDNDGISDLNECGLGEGTVSSPFTSLYAANLVATSGRYYFDLGSGAFQADVDTTNGGGWVLILQYVHQGGTNPSLNVVTAGADLPTLSTGTLGDDESGSASWGHIGNAGLSDLGADELRWYGSTSAHSRIIHFSSSVGVGYAESGTGSFDGIATTNTKLSGHSANLPDDSDTYFIDQGDNAITNFPFYKVHTYHWGVSGSGTRWEVDNPSSGSTNSTIHRVWARSSSPDVCDTDNDGTPNYLDLDSDNDGCNDVVESGGTDGDNDGILDGSGFDGNGQVTGGTGGYDGVNGNETEATMLQMDTQPTDATICPEASATFTGAASSLSTSTFTGTAPSTTPDYSGSTPATGDLVYQWQEQVGGAGAWNDIADGGIYSNATTASLTLTSVSLSASTNKYRLIVTSTKNVCASITSSEITLTVNPEPVNTTPPTATVCSDVALNHDLTGDVSLTGNTFSWSAADNANVTGETTIASTATSITDTLTNTSGSVQTVVYTITPTSSDGCAGDPYTYTVTVNPEPFVASAPTDMVCSDVALNHDLTSDVNLAGAAFSWSAAANANVTGETTTASTATSITDTLTNTSGSVQTVVYTVTPTSSDGCAGDSYTYTVTVNPEPFVAAAPTATVCSDVALNHDLTGDVNLAGATFSWSAADNANVTGETTSASTATSITDTLTNTSGSVQTVVYTITPTSSDGCAGDSYTYTVTVNPEPFVAAAPTDTVCSDVALNHDLTGDVNLAGVTFSWSAADNANVTGETTTASTATSITDTLTNTSGSVQTVVYTITPTSSDGCTGNSYTYTVTVNPEPFVAAAPTDTVCSDVALNHDLTGDVNLAGATFSWSAADNANVTGETTSASTATSITDTLTNTSGSVQTVVYTITPTSSDGCAGDSYTYTVTVNPEPFVAAAPTDTDRKSVV